MEKNKMLTNLLYSVTFVFNDYKNIANSCIKNERLQDFFYNKIIDDFKLIGYLIIYENAMIEENLNCVNKEVMYMIYNKFKECSELNFSKLLGIISQLTQHSN